jgi:hypothetical protein
MIEAPVAPAAEPTVEPVSPLRLSEALRLGSIGTRQGYGQLINKDGALCAVGTILRGFGWDDNDIWSPREPAPPALTHLTAEPCPACAFGFRHMYVEAAVVHLNDYHHWTRSEIADWLEGRGL